jgi:hypothetical protein
MRLTRDITGVAATQHALVASWQLRAMGMRTWEIDRLRDGPHWDGLTKRVLALRGVPWDDDRRLMAAVLDASPGATIAGATALARWGAPGFRLEPIQVVRHRGVSRRTSPLAKIHEVVDLLPQQIKVVNGIPVSSPSLAICHIAATEHPKRVERALEWLIRERLVDGGVFRRTVDEYTGRGRSGSALLHELDDARGPGYVPYGSGNEMRFAEILERDGQRPMRRQASIIDGEEWTGRADFRDDDLPLVVEVQSEKYHSLLLDAAEDERRRQA